MEEWKDIEGYEGIYQVSNLGRVKSLRDNFHRPREKILNPVNDKLGYNIVCLHKDGKHKNYKIHRLVAIHFIENPNNYPQVNHKDENKTNNTVDNLEWCTSEYNNNYGTRNKKAQKSLKEKYKNQKIHSCKKVRCINTGEIFNSMTEAAKWAGNSRCNGIYRQIKGERKHCGKHPATGELLKWEYVEEGD